MGGAFSAVFYGMIGSILAVAVVALIARTGTGLVLLGKTYQVAYVIRKLGITKFHGSRDDYEGTLPTYLAQAKHSIGIVSISLKQTHDEGDLISIFRRRLAENSSFRISISLVAPKSPACQCAATSLNLTQDQLEREVGEMLSALVEFRSSLPQDQQHRLLILVHDSLPMGSAILLDASAQSGVIQIETKLHRTPRVGSFGFEIVGPTPFFEHHYLAWRGVLDESRIPTPDELGGGRL